MKYKALVSFSGLMNMKKDEIKAIKDKKLVDDLLKAGFIMEYKEIKPKKEA